MRDQLGAVALTQPDGAQAVPPPFGVEFDQWIGVRFCRVVMRTDGADPQAEDAQAVALHVHPPERFPVGLRDAVQRIGPDLSRVVVTPVVVRVVERRRSVQLIHADGVVRGREHHA